MPKLSLFNFVVALLLSLYLQNAAAIVLKEIRSPIGVRDTASLGRRSDLAALDLRSSEIFLWGGPGSTTSVFGNLTVYMPGDSENILSMEKFYGMVNSVQCTDQGMTLQFIDDVTFAYAQRVWDWVNGVDNHTFIMVAGAGDCGTNTHRQPYMVSKITYDEVGNIAHLVATIQDWQSAAHTYDLQVGSIPVSYGGVQARDLSHDVSLNLATSFPFSISLAEDGLSSAIECSKCGTTGSVAFELRLSQKFLVPTGASMRMSPKGVSAQVQIKLTNKGELSKSKTFKKTAVHIPFDAITIPGGIANIGPFFDVDFGFQISDVSGSASVSSGATVSISDSAILELDLLNPSNNKFSGWVPSVDAMPLTVDAKISGGLSVYAQPALKLEAEAIGHGYEIGLNLKMPNIEAKLEISDSSSGACNTNHAFGVQYNTTIGASLKVQASNVKNEADPSLDITIADVSVPLAHGCHAFGPSVADASTPSSKGAPPASVATNSPPSPSASAPASGTGSPPSNPPGGSLSSTTFCVNNAGLSGQCISTGACSDGGGNSEAGHCPGAANIQCCTFPDGNTSADKSCKINSGQFGECVSTSTCANAGGESEPGHCPGAASIQCCTYGACTASGKSGLCKPTSSCSGNSVPGYCPGDSDIQCCVAQIDIPA